MKEVCSGAMTQQNGGPQLKDHPLFLLNPEMLIGIGKTGLLTYPIILQAFGKVLTLPIHLSSFGWLSIRLFPCVNLGWWGRLSRLLWLSLIWGSMDRQGCRICHEVVWRCCSPQPTSPHWTQHPHIWGSWSESTGYRWIPAHPCPLCNSYAAHPLKWSADPWLSCHQLPVVWLTLESNITLYFQST